MYKRTLVIQNNRLQNYLYKIEEKEKLKSWAGVVIGNEAARGTKTAPWRRRAVKDDKH